MKKFKIVYHTIYKNTVFIEAESFEEANHIAFSKNPYVKQEAYTKSLETDFPEAYDYCFETLPDYKVIKSISEEEF